jgi:transcription elongation factor GreA
MSGLIPMTPENFKRLCAELETLKTTERRQIREALAHAMSFGDFSENAELDEAKRAHSTLEGRIAQLEKMISRAEVIDLAESDQISVGATVIAEDLARQEEICLLVGVGNHDHAEAIVVTPDSPIGRELMGKRAQDEIEVETPAGRQKYRILSIAY